MSPERMRIRIAEQLGWKHVGLAGRGDGLAKELVGTLDGRTYHRIPDYPNDLNACREMEGSLTVEQKNLFIIMLMKPVSGCGEFEVCKYCCFASAIQRCEAFCLTTGIREDAQPTLPPAETPDRAQ